MNNFRNPDFLIIGAGVIGLNVALALKRRYPDHTIAILEKEQACGLHASTRNSGVLHAGFYYSADSLKAQLTRDGCKRLTDYCLEKGLKINRCGKLVVARNESEIEGLHELKRRGNANGVALNLITEKEAQEIEPRVITCQYALFSPTTATIDPKEVMHSLENDCRASNIQILHKTCYLGKTSRGIHTNRGTFETGFLINAAGLFADRIALDFGFSKNYRILPFKGLYLYGNPKEEKLNTHIYPVPDLGSPFLGVHFTLTVDNQIKIGPTAIPAFWRENYKGFQNFNLKECIEIMARESKLLLRDAFGFRKLAFNEAQKHYRPHLVSLASKLVKGIKAQNYTLWGRPGIRAQLLDIRKNSLEMDFKFEGDGRSFHILNAVSPAFTCSIPFSDFLVNQMKLNFN